MHPSKANEINFWNPSPDQHHLIKSNIMLIVVVASCKLLTYHIMSAQFPFYFILLFSFLIIYWFLISSISVFFYLLLEYCYFMFV